jgi:hypothetical protein
LVSEQARGREPSQRLYLTDLFGPEVFRRAISDRQAPDGARVPINLGSSEAAYRVLLEVLDGELELAAVMGWPRGGVTREQHIETLATVGLMHAELRDEDQPARLVSFGETAPTRPAPSTSATSRTPSRRTGSGSSPRNLKARSPAPEQVARCPQDPTAPSDTALPIGANRTPR